MDAAESAISIKEIEEHRGRARPQPRHHSPKPLSFRTALAVRNLLFSADGNGAVASTIQIRDIGGTVSRHNFSRATKTQLTPGFSPLGPTEGGKDARVGADALVRRL